MDSSLCSSLSCVFSSLSGLFSSSTVMSAKTLLSWRRREIEDDQESDEQRGQERPTTHQNILTRTERTRELTMTVRMKEDIIVILDVLILKRILSAKREEHSMQCLHNLIRFSFFSRNCVGKGIPRIKVHSPRDILEGVLEGEEHRKSTSSSTVLQGISLILCITKDCDATAISTEILYRQKEEETVIDKNTLSSKRKKKQITWFTVQTVCSLAHS